MDRKLTVLVFSRHYLPGYRACQLIYPLSNIVNRLRKEIDFYIITLDRDASSRNPYDNISLGEWNQIDGVNVWYLNPQSLAVKTLVELFNEIEPDVIYLNCFFDNILTQRVLWARRLDQLGKTPVILAPRDELSNSRLKLGWLKKKIYLQYAKMMKLYDNLIWHAVSEDERIDITNTLDFVTSRQVRVAMDLIFSEENGVTQPKTKINSPVLRLCYSSPVSPEYQLHFVLSVLAQIKTPIAFTIYGPIVTDDYWEECQALIAALPENIQTDYQGNVPFLTVKSTLAQHDLLFSPMSGGCQEYLIFAAVAAGIPILTCDPISNQQLGEALKQNILGWAYSLEATDSFVTAIEALGNWTAEQHLVFAQQAQRFTHEQLNDTKALILHRILFAQ